MNPAPLPQPAPFTCPHCGLGLESKPEFCPHCGARLEATRQSGLSLFAAVALGVGLLIFGAIGACGVFDTIKAFQQGPYMDVLLIFSVPALLIGLVGFIACLRPFLKRKG